ncbi:MAG TPA: hypothetical protein VLV83_20505 [Acidobacteriota bacterium]|nr:hypothetical protein [Acidobacteriota bacterium]
MSSTTHNRRWGFAWLGLATALAVHVADEAFTDFLPLYNSIVTGLRDSYSFVPFPTFTFPIWLGGLIAGVLLLYALTPFAFAGRLGLRYLAYPLSVLMILNALGHTAASVYLGTPAPGVYSSPLLLLAAVALLVTTRSITRSTRRWRFKLDATTANTGTNRRRGTQ